MILLVTAELEAINHSEAEYVGHNLIMLATIAVSLHGNIRKGHEMHRECIIENVNV